MSSSFESKISPDLVHVILQAMRLPRDVEVRQILVCRDGVDEVVNHR